jgi:hypothetical protein
MSSPPTAALPTRARRFVLPAPVLVVVLAAMLLAPALVAEAVTGPQQPSGFISQPWRGWTLLARVLTGAGSAEAASPGAALRIANDTWGTDSGLDPRTAELVYLAADDQLRVPIGTTRADTTVDGGSDLAWVIEGTSTRSAANVVIGVIDYDTAKIRYDLLQSAPPAQEGDPA